MSLIDWLQQIWIVMLSLSVLALAVVVRDDRRR